jgi:hypothetical protein
MTCPTCGGRKAVPIGNGAYEPCPTCNTDGDATVQESEAVAAGAAVDLTDYPE